MLADPPKEDMERADEKEGGREVEPDGTRRKGGARSARLRPMTGLKIHISPGLPRWKNSHSRGARQGPRRGELSKYLQFKEFHAQKQNKPRFPAQACTYLPRRLRPVPAGTPPPWPTLLITEGPFRNVFKNNSGATHRLRPISLPRTLTMPW
jgi:hypothetical protein